MSSDARGSERESLPARSVFNLSESDVEDIRPRAIAKR